MKLPLYPRRPKEMNEKTGGRRRYPTNKAPPAYTNAIGSADEMVSIVDEAIGFASSITFVVCCAASATV